MRTISVCKNLSAARSRSGFAPDSPIARGMTNRHARSADAQVVVSGMLLLLAGCGGGTTNPNNGFGGSTGFGGSGFGGDTGSTCPVTGATGTLSIRISGTPSGHGSVSLAGGSTLTAGNDLSLTTGPQTVTAYL